MPDNRNTHKNSNIEIHQNPYPEWYRFVIEVILFLTYVVFGMTFAAAGSFLKDIMKELSLTLSQASFLNTSVTFAKVFGPTLAAFIAAKLGLKKAFLLASTLICLGIFAPLAPDYPMLLLARFGMGIGGALVIVYFTPITMQWFSKEERIFVNGINFVSISVGMMLGFFITDPLINALGGSWKKALIIYSSISIFLAIMWLIFGKEKDGKNIPAQKTGNPSCISGYIDALKDKNTWKITFAYAGTLCHYMTFITYFPTFYKNSPFFATDSWVLKAPAIVMLSGIPAVLTGIMLLKMFKLRIPIIRLAGCILVPAAMGMFLFKGEASILICAVLTGFGMFLWRSPFFTIPQELPGATPEKAGYMMSIFWAVSYTAATIAVWSVGRLTEITGTFIPGFILVSILAGSLLVGSFIIPETGQSRIKKNS
ncbi:MAG: MFS transporter [Candidatus Eremiobacteraeota bacterium]|nr:MFS transporter [Candidatus Eremiobacteraeota bacterium]